MSLSDVELLILAVRELTETLRSCKHDHPMGREKTMNTTFTEEDKQVAHDILTRWNGCDFVIEGAHGVMCTAIAQALAVCRATAFELGKEANRADTTPMLAELDRALQEAKVDNESISKQLMAKDSELDVLRLRVEVDLETMLEDDNLIGQLQDAVDSVKTRTAIAYAEGRKTAFDEALSVVASERLTGSTKHPEDLAYENALDDVDRAIRSVRVAGPVKK